MRGLLTYFGIFFLLGHKAFTVKLVDLCSDDSLSATLKWLVNDTYREYDALNTRIKEIEKRLKADLLQQTNESSNRR